MYRIDAHPPASSHRRRLVLVASLLVALVVTVLTLGHARADGPPLHIPPGGIGFIDFDTLNPNLRAVSLTAPFEPAGWDAWRNVTNLPAVAQDGAADQTPRIVNGPTVVFNVPIAFNDD